MANYGSDPIWFTNLMVCVRIFLLAWVSLYYGIRLWMINQNTSSMNPDDQQNYRFSKLIILGVKCRHRY